MTELVEREDQAQPYDLGDRYRSGAGPVLLTGVQAIARAARRAARARPRAGLRVATFVSGYQGSPLGGVDKMLARHAAACWPSTTSPSSPASTRSSPRPRSGAARSTLPAGTATHDGVVGVWYGKGPGVDRATDALRHANMYGANPRGGVLLLVGDDPASKSSTVPAVSERSLAALGIPVLFPRNAEEIVTMGMHGVALSRASGCVVGAEDRRRRRRRRLDRRRQTFAAWTSPSPRSNGREGRSSTGSGRWPSLPDSVDRRGRPVRPAPGRRARLRRRQRTRRRSRSTRPRARIGIAATGTTFDSRAPGPARPRRRRRRAAPRRYPAAADRHAVPAGRPAPSRTFADGLEQLLVVEDKTAFVETQVREILYGTEPTRRGSSASRTPTGRPLDPRRRRAHRRPAAGAAAPRAATTDVELKKPPPPRTVAGSAPRQARRRTSAAAARTTARPRCPRDRSAGGGIGCHTHGDDVRPHGQRRSPA